MPDTRMSAPDAIQMPEDLEEAYREIFVVQVEQIPLAQMDLRQPHAYRVVRSVTTYGAYEQPI